MHHVNQYLDYREWLSEFVQQKKASSSLWSYRWIASRLEMDAGNLVKVMQKERHLPEASIVPLADLAGLSAHEIEYLSILYQFNKARTETKARQWFEKLLDLKYVAPKTIEADQYRFYSEWWHVTILALLHLNPELRDPARIGRMLEPNIASAEVQQSLQLLQDLQLLREVKGGRWVVNHSLLSSGERFKSWAIHPYQKQTLELAIRSLDSHPVEHRDFSTLTLTLGATDLSRIKDLAREFRRQVLAVVKESQSQDRVFQMNLQLFPLSKEPNL